VADGATRRTGVWARLRAAAAGGRRHRRPARPGPGRPTLARLLRPSSSWSWL